MRDIEISTHLFGQLLHQWSAYTAAYLHLPADPVSDVLCDHELNEVLKHVRLRKSIDESLRQIGLDRIEDPDDLWDEESPDKSDCLELPVGA